MRILFLSWRDIKSPHTGGAETFTHYVLKRLVERGYSITHYSCGFKGGKKNEVIDGVTYVRGPQGLLRFVNGAKRFYKNDPKWDWVVDQRNSHHCFTHYWLPKHQPRALFIHQTTRELWYYETKFPVSFLGNLQEALTLRSQNYFPAFTASKTTAEELIRDFGFKKDRVFPFHQGLITPPPPIETLPEKFNDPTFIYVGRFSKYKGIDAAIKAIILFREKNGKGKLYIIGKKNLQFEQKIWNPIKKRYPNVEEFVTITGFVSEETRDELMGKSHAILVPSQREGWGLIVTESNAQNTPAIVYPSPGLEEAVKYGATGIITKKKNYQSLYNSMQYLWDHPKERKEITKKAREWSEDFTWDIAGKQADDFFKNQYLLNLFKE